MQVSLESHAAWVDGALARYEAPLIRYALRVTGEVEIARDVVQDTFLRLCQADRAELEGHLAPWLYRVCRNRALDVMKKENRMQALDTQQLEARPSPAAPPGTVAERNETEAMLLDAIAGLPEKQREAFTLKFQEQLSYKEISEITGYPLTNVRYLIHNSLKRMGQMLGRQLALAGEGPRPT